MTKNKIKESTVEDLRNEIMRLKDAIRTLFQSYYKLEGKFMFHKHIENDIVVDLVKYSNYVGEDLE